MLTCDFDSPPNKYAFHAAPGSTNPPSGLGGNSWFVTQLYPGNASYSAQLAFGFNQSKLALRRKSGSPTWTDWEYFYPDGYGNVYKIPITSSNLALYGASIESRYSHFVRSGRVVTCTLAEIKTAASYTDVWNNLVHIPVGFRPASIIYDVGRKLRGETEVALKAEGTELAFVKIPTSTTSGSITFFATLTWITTDDLPPN